MKRYWLETEKYFVFVDENADETTVKMIPKNNIPSIVVKNVARAQGAELPPIHNTSFKKKRHHTNFHITPMSGAKIVIEKILGEFEEK